LRGLGDLGAFENPLSYARIGEQALRGPGVLDAIEALAEAVLDSSVRQKERNDEDVIASVVRRFGTPPSPS